MGSSAFVALVTWVIAHGYFLFFLATFLEGPLVTTAAGVAAALGYYNIWAIIFISIAGDLTADLVYYTIGFWSRKTLIKRYGSYVGLTPERIATTEQLIRRHMGKALIIIKLSPVIPVPGLLIMGTARVPVKRFVITSLLITGPKSVLFAVLGFVVGRAYEKFSGLFVNSEYILFGLLLITIAFYVLYQKFTGRLAKKIK